MKRSIDAEKWARNLEAELDRCDFLPDPRLAEQMTVRELFERYLREIKPHKRSASTEAYRIKALLRRDIAHRALAMLKFEHIASYRDERLAVASSATVNCYCLPEETTPTRLRSCAAAR